MLCPEDKMRVACFLLAVSLWSGAGVHAAAESAPAGRRGENVPHFRGPRPPRDSGGGGGDESWINKIFSFVTPNNSGKFILLKCFFFMQKLKKNWPIVNNYLLLNSYIYFYFILRGFNKTNFSEGASGSRKAEEEYRSSGETGFRAETYQPDQFTNEFVESDRRYAGRPVPSQKGRGKLHRYGEHTRPAVESNIGADISRLIGGILPNSYYSRPKYRYPYYDKSGKERSNVITHNYYYVDIW